MSRWVIGENVPWSVSWTGEDAFHLSPSSVFPGRLDLLQVEHPGSGRPRFAALNLTRQKLGMTTQLCHVCGRRTLTRDRHIFPVESGGFVAVGETMRYAGTVPPVHARCAQSARLLCPHLGHAMATPVAFPSEDSLLVPHPGVPEGMEDLAKSLPKGRPIVFNYLRIYGPRFSRHVERLRKARGGRTAESWAAFTA